jgi:hypothetical protein
VATPFAKHGQFHKTAGGIAYPTAARGLRQQGWCVDGIRVLDGEIDVSRKEGGLVEGQVTSWEKVGVITGVSGDARSGGMETTCRYWLLEPGGTQRRVELDPFKVVGRFTSAEQKNGKAASEAFRGLATAEK